MDRSWRISQHPTYLFKGLMLSLVSGLVVGTAAAVAAKSYPLGLVMFITSTAFAGMIYFSWGAYD